jgi:hypothetical protein
MSKLELMSNFIDGIELRLYNGCRCRFEDANTPYRSHINSKGVEPMNRRTFIGFAMALTLAACNAPRAHSAPATTALEAVNNYTTALQNRDGRSVSETFHPSAMLHSIDGNKLRRNPSGTFARGVTLGGMLGGGRPLSPALKSNVKTVDVDESAGVIRVDLDFGTDGIVDYLMVARIGQEWKVISKIFEDPNETLNTDLEAASLPIKRFLASREKWDAEAFSASVYDLAQIFTISESQLVAGTTPQTILDYGRALTAQRVGESGGTIETIETFGKTGYARFQSLGADGTVLRRAAFLLRSNSGWRIISLHSWAVAQVPAPPSR